jgi:hypothetical protein
VRSFVETSYVEELPWRAVRFICIPAGFAVPADDLCHAFRKFRDRKVLAGIHRSFIVVAVQQELARVCQVVAVHELPPRL